MTQRALAKKLDVSLQTVNTLINERRGMTAEMAVRLARVFDTSAQLWMNLQTNHDLWLAQNAFRAHG
jgi:addiction module HigA family antidote